MLIHVSGILQTALNDITQSIGIQVPYFHPFRSTVNHFPDVVPFRVFLLTPMLKFHSAIKLQFFWADRPKKLYPIFPHDQHTYNKVWLKLDEAWESYK